MITPMADTDRLESLRKLVDMYADHSGVVILKRFYLLAMAHHRDIDADTALVLLSELLPEEQLVAFLAAAKLGILTLEDI